MPCTVHCEAQDLRVAVTRHPELAGDGCDESAQGTVTFAQVRGASGGVAPVGMSVPSGTGWRVMVLGNGVFAACPEHAHLIDQLHDRILATTSEMRRKLTRQ